MALADSLRATAGRIRGIPGRLGLRPHSVTLLLRAYAGAVTGEGAVTETQIPIIEAGGYPPKVRLLSPKELAIGGLGAGSLEVGPITPSYAGGGTDIATLLQPTLPVGNVRLVKIHGPQFSTDALYRVESVKADSALHYTLTLAPVAAT